MKTIYAYTGQSPAVGYVGYINVRQHVNGIAVTVRSEGDGKQGEIILTPEQCEHLAVDLLAHINGEAAGAQPVAAPVNQVLLEALTRISLLTECEIAESIADAALATAQETAK